MRFREFRPQHNPQVMIIPMIDIIFFLLVFFMMSTLYMVEQRNIPVSLPAAAAAQAGQERQIPVTVTEDGRLYVEQEEIAAGLLVRRVQAELARDPETAFILRADRRVAYGQVITVLDELKRAGVRRVSVATDAKPR